MDFENIVRNTEDSLSSRLLRTFLPGVCSGAQLLLPAHRVIQMLQAFSKRPDSRLM